MRYRPVDDKHDSGNWLVDIIDGDDVLRPTTQWIDLEDLAYDMEIYKIQPEDD